MLSKRSTRSLQVWKLAAASAGALAASLCGAQARAAWPADVKSRAALISAGPLIAGVYRAGLDIRLAPGVLTYWRDPGDAGVPPTFNFKGSTNVASVKVFFPAPTRILESGVTTFGYHRQVVFPIDVRPLDPAKPSELRIDAHYATCDSLCLPARAQTTLALSPDAPTSVKAALITTWAGRVPKPLPKGDRPVATPVSSGGKHVWRLSFKGAAPSDVFVEGPKDWHFDSHRAAPGGFMIELAERPLGGRLPVVARLTMVGPSGSFQTSVKLDAAPRGG